MVQTTNRFEKYINDQSNDLKLVSKKSNLADKHLLNLSTKSEGTPLTKYFSPTDIKLISEFMTAVKKRQFPNSTDLKLYSLLPIQVLDQESYKFGPKISKGIIKKIINKLSWQTLWSGKGYLIGVLTNINSLTNSASLVYLCSDSKLRCSRNFPVFDIEQTKAFGFGDIPELTKLSTALIFRAGKYYEQYNSQGSMELVFKNPGLEVMLKEYITSLII